MFLPASEMDVPSKVMSPESIFSSALTQRSIVDLPEPEGPAMTMASPRPTFRSIPSSTRLVPKLFRICFSSTRCPFVVAWSPMWAAVY